MIKKFLILLFSLYGISFASELSEIQKIKTKNLTELKKIEKLITDQMNKCYDDLFWAIIRGEITGMSVFGADEHCKKQYKKILERVQKTIKKCEKSNQ
ncbi:MAG: hypothetical protein ACOYT8_05520 [Candidatus Dependentiae bacterium]